MCGCRRRIAGHERRQRRRDAAHDVGDRVGGGAIRPRYLPGGNVYAGMLRAGTVTEQICTVAKSLVAALCMYLAPMRWRFTPRLLMGVSRSVCSTSGM